MTTTDVGLPAQPARPRLGGFRTPKLGNFATPATILKLVLLAAVVIFLVVFVGPSNIGATLLKVAVAVGLSVALFVAASRIFNLAYGAWTSFCSLAGFVVGFVTFLVLDGNRILRDVSPGPWLWAIIGGTAVGSVMFLLSAPRGRVARLPLAVAGFAGVGVLIALAVDDAYYPALDWGKLLACAAIGAGVGGAVRALGRSERTMRSTLLAALLGGAIGWLVGGWGGADLGGGTVGEALVATVIPLAAIGVRVGIADSPSAAQRRQIEDRAQPWIFITPALALIAMGLLIPLLRTIYISFKDRDSVEFVGLDNFRDVIGDDKFLTATDWWDRLWGSRLWLVALGVALIGLAIGIINGRRTRRAFDKEPASILPLLIAFFLGSCAILATVRGTLANNIWWVIVVTSLATAFGLAVAVLADRAKAENVAKSLIFLPMAISFVGAGVIWRFVYMTRNVSKPQTGMLNAMWVGLGQLSNSGWQKWAVAAVIVVIIAGLLWLTWQSIQQRNGTRAGFALGFALLLAILLVLLLGPGIGGFEVNNRGVVRPTIIDFVRESPYNNMWLMVVLIWIQTGFALVIFSSAIKAVPTELTEAARIDGANEAQVFWKVTLPQIGPTIAVVVTTLVITVLKVFDIVKVTTGGQFGTQVIANQMVSSVVDRNAGQAATLATLLFIAVVPVMIINLRRMRKG